jgi:hypothetical protein
MTVLKIVPRVVESAEHEGIKFSCCTFIDIYIDDEPLNMNSSFEGVVYWPELRKSAEGSGAFLLFTCYCGIAEDGGWEPVEVKHDATSVSWLFERNGSREYRFSRSDYLFAVTRCETDLDLERYPLAVFAAAWPV